MCFKGKCFIDINIRNQSRKANAIILLTIIHKGTSKYDSKVVSNKRYHQSEANKKTRAWSDLPFQRKRFLNGSYLSVLGLLR